MPTYDYKCTECNHAFEMFQMMTDDPISNCPECDGIVKRLIGTGAGPIFKGSGFYQTDYKIHSANNAKSNSAKSIKPKSLDKDKKPTDKKTTD
jgi:putative FmdB family regulatory protein